MLLFSVRFVFVGANFFQNRQAVLVRLLPNAVNYGNLVIFVAMQHDVSAVLRNRKHMN